MTPKQRTEAERILVEWGQQCYNHWGTEANKKKALASLENIFNGGGEEAEIVNRMDRCEWYCRGINSVAMDLLNGKDVKLTLERANQRSQKWEAMRVKEIAKLGTTPPDERKDV